MDNNVVCLLSLGGYGRKFFGFVSFFGDKLPLFKSGLMFIGLVPWY